MKLVHPCRDCLSKNIFYTPAEGVLPIIGNGPHDKQQFFDLLSLLMMEEDCISYTVDATEPTRDNPTGNKMTILKKVFSEPTRDTGEPIGDKMVILKKVFSEPTRDKKGLKEYKKMHGP